MQKIKSILKIEKEEIADIYNENLELVGQATKSEIVKEGMWCKSFHCWIIRPSSPGYILFQKRGAKKSTFPNLLDISAAGHYKTGEIISDGIREINEELNVDVDFASLTPLGIKLDIGKVGDFKIREFCYVYFMINQNEPEQYSLGTDEVDGLFQISVPDGLELFSGNKEEIQAKGIEFDYPTKKVIAISKNVNISHFVPRIDNYFYKILILADRFLKGEKHLVI